MRKLYLLVASSVALVAFMGFSANAFAAPIHDPGCDAWGNEFGVFDLSIDTPDSYVEHAVSGVIGSGFGCGSEIDDGFVGAGTLNNHADIGVPPGVEIADSDLVGKGSNAGTAKVNILMHGVAGGASFQDGPDGTGVPSVVRTDDKAECERERSEELTGTPIQGEIVSCLKGSNPVGTNWNWSTRTPGGKLYLTIGPMHGALGIEPGLTFINLTLCSYYGSTDPEVVDCGTEGDQFQQKNGNAAYVPPFGDRGLYTATVTNENGDVSGATESWSSRVPWCSLVGGVVKGVGMETQLSRVVLCPTAQLLPDPTE